jgi:hypothetical protein
MGSAGVRKFRWDNDEYQIARAAGYCFYGENDDGGQSSAVGGASGGGGMGMGGGLDSSPAGSKSSSGTGNAPNQAMGVDAFDGSEGASKDTSTIEGFRAALAKAMGATIENNVDREAFDAEMEEAANNRAIAAAVEARDKAIRDAADLGELNSGMMGIDNDDDNDRGLLGPSVDDDRSLEMSQEKDQERDVNKDVDIGIGFETPENAFRNEESKRMGSTVENDVDRQAFENAMKESVQAYRDISGKLGHPDFGFSGTAVEGAAPSGLESNVGGPSLGDPGQSIGDRNLANRSRRAALALENFNNQEQTIKRDPNLTERERARKLAAIQDTKRTTEYGILVGYAFPGQTIAGIKTSTLARALASLLGLGIPMGIMSVLDKTLGKKGFGQVERDALTSIARDIEESGGSSATAGYGGGSDETKRKFYEYIMQVEPWAKGLSDRQINYYLENEEELEWVRNLYKDMTNA